jgi:hypothetical protein
VAKLIATDFVAYIDTIFDVPTVQDNAGFFDLIVMKNGRFKLL